MTRPWPSTIRNTNCTAIAPTATISNIIGVDASIEPCFGNLSVKSNLPGEFTIINSYLVQYLKRLGLWDDVMVMDLKHFDGSLGPIDRVPTDIKALYATAFELETHWLVEAAGRRQKWIDQGQSLNIYMTGASGKKLDENLQADMDSRLENDLLPAHHVGPSCRQIDGVGRSDECDALKQRNSQWQCSHECTRGSGRRGQITDGDWPSHWH